MKCCEKWIGKRVVPFSKKGWVNFIQPSAMASHCPQCGFPLAEATSSTRVVDLEKGWCGCGWIMEPGKFIPVDKIEPPICKICHKEIKTIKHLVENE